MIRSTKQTIDMFVAINEVGQYYLSQISAQDAMTNLVQRHGGKAFRVIDLAIEIPWANEEETRRRRAEKLKLRVVG